MKKLRYCKTLAVLLVCVEWLFLPCEVMAAPPQSPPSNTTGVLNAKTAIHDVALGRDGMLRGQLVNPQGRALIGRAISVQRVGDNARRVVTDRDGRFAARELRGGVYQISSFGTTGVFRLWADGTAPPSAQETILLVSDDLVQRGQQPFGPSLFNDPILTGLLIAAAVAIPVAIHKTKKDRPVD